MSKDSFKKTVKSAIEKFAFEQLKRECSLQTKTSNLVYEHFRCQPYLTHLYPSQAKVILQCRAKCLKIKKHRPFLFKNKICRWCNLEEESLSHILDCGSDPLGIDAEIVDNIGDCDENMAVKLVLLSQRIKTFIDMVDF